MRAGVSGPITRHTGSVSARPRPFVTLRSTASMSGQYPPIQAVLFPFTGSELGGSHISCFLLGSALSQKYGLESVVMCPDGTTLAAEAARHGLTIVATDERPAARHSAAYDLRKCVSRFRNLAQFPPANTIVHFNDPFAMRSWGLAVKARRWPIVYHHRSLNRMTLLRRMFLRVPSHIICISNEVENNVSFVPRERRTTLLNPFILPANISRAAAKKEIMESAGISGQPKLVGFVGNFWRRKRPFFFLDVAARMRRIDPTLRFIVFGREGDFTPGELRSYACHIGVSDCVTLAGFRLPAERNIAGLDLLLAPALSEPFGRTLVEAMLLGTPFVATSDGGHKEIAAKWPGGGVMVPVDNGPDAFANAACLVLADEGIGLSDRQRADLRREASPVGHAGHVMDVYRRVMVARTSGG
jgi:glycosyltransferase involved in cell wall biosynthesis